MVAAIALAAPVGADPSPNFTPKEQAYLDLLDVYGFNITSEDSAFAVKLGHAACADLENGASPADEAAAVYRMTPKWTEKMSGDHTEPIHLLNQRRRMC